jgi:pilus assembly protein FimV
MDPRGLIALVSITIGTYPLADASALGLGDAELRSRLNEPLVVEIDLIGVPSQLDRLEATIGRDAHTGASPGLSIQLRAELSVDRAGRPSIRVTTEQAVREPIVGFLLVVEGAREHVMRDYTVLLDPPGYSLPVRPAPETRRAPVRALEPASSAVPAPEAVIQPPPQRIGPVAHGDTLSRLAMRHAAGPGVTWAQMTWALFEANPHAFIDRDINKLRSGVFLTIPSTDIVLRRSYREAVDLITAGATPAPVAESSIAAPAEPAAPLSPVPAPTIADSGTAPESPPLAARQEPAPPAATPAVAMTPEAPEPLFRVLAPGDIPDTRTAGTVGSPVSPRERERLRQLVEEANRQIRDSHVEIAKARTQLASTALQISTLVETVEKKDSEIRGLENRLADLHAFVTQQRTAAADADPGWLQRVLLEMLILVTLVGVLAVTLSRWKSAPQQTGGGAEAETIALEFHPATAAQSPPAAKMVDDVLPEDLVEEDDITDAPDPDPSIPADETEYEEIELRGDQLIEANAYLAYGYHEKAREVLEQFIKEDPAHSESRLVMLRVLHALREKRKFRRHAEALLELVDDQFDERWIEAARLGRAILPEERLFDADTHGRAEDEKWEKTVWTGTRPDPTDTDDHIYLDLEEFKYVDLFLLDSVEAPEDEAEEEDESPSIDQVAGTPDEPEDLEAELEKWRAEHAGTTEDQGIKLDSDILLDDDT